MGESLCVLLFLLAISGSVSASLSSSPCSAASTESKCAAKVISGTGSSSYLWRSLGLVSLSQDQSAASAKWPSSSVAGAGRLAGNIAYVKAVVPSDLGSVHIALNLRMNITGGYVCVFLVDADQWNWREQGQGFVDGTQYFSYRYHPYSVLAEAIRKASFLHYSGPSAWWGVLQSVAFNKSVTIGSWTDYHVQFEFLAGKINATAYRSNESATSRATSVTLPSRVAILIGATTDTEVNNVTVWGSATMTTLDACSWCSGSQTCVEKGSLCPANCSARESSSDVCLAESPGWWDDWYLLYSANYLNSTYKNEIRLVQSIPWQVGAAVYNRSIPSSIGSLTISFELYTTGVADGACVALLNSSSWDGWSIGDRGGRIGYADFQPGYMAVGWALWGGNWSGKAGIPYDGVTARGGQSTSWDQFGPAMSFENGTWIANKITFTFKSNQTSFTVASGNSSYSTTYGVAPPDKMSLLIIGATGGYIGEFRVRNVRVQSSQDTPKTCNFCATTNVCQSGSNCTTEDSSSSSSFYQIPSSSASVQSISSSSALESSNSGQSSHLVHESSTTLSESVYAACQTSSCATIKLDTNSSVNTTEIAEIIAALLSLDLDTVTCTVIEIDLNSVIVLISVTDISTTTLVTSLSSLIDDTGSGLYDTSIGRIIDTSYGAVAYSTESSSAPASAPVSGAGTLPPLVLLQVFIFITAIVLQ